MMLKTILVVEDDSDMRALIRRTLLNDGYAVRAAADGHEAPMACERDTPDLIISDVHMPRMSGFDMIRILKSEPGMKDIPVIFLTVDEGARDESQDLGAIEFLHKPFKPAALLMLVGKYLASKKRGEGQPKAS